MSGAAHFVSNGFSSHTVPDWKFLPCQLPTRRTSTSFSSCNRRQKLSPGANCLMRTTFTCYTRSMYFCCKASSNKSDPDFLRQYRGSSRSKSWQSKERENFENLEDNLLPSKNGSMVSLSNNQRYSATTTPGRKEKDIVELFRKVQALLRERAEIKEEKRVEAAQRGQGERGTIDSLLKLLRKHSAAQGKKSSIDVVYDHDQPDRTNPFDEQERSDQFEVEQTFSFFKSDNFGTEDSVNDPKYIPPSRPASSFKHKNPVPSAKFMPVFLAEEGDRSCRPTLKSQKLMPGVFAEPKPEPEPALRHQVEPEHEPVMKLESSDGESEIRLELSDFVETEQGISEPSTMQNADLSSLKIMELRGLAKSRGIKGYSKLKKSELLGLLIVNSA